MSALLTFPQSGKADVVSDILKFCSTDTSSVRSERVDAMDVLDFIRSTDESCSLEENDVDLMSAIYEIVAIDSVSRLRRSSGMEALNALSDMCDPGEFYKSGVFADRLHPDYYTQKTIIPPICGVKYHDSSWGRVTSLYGFRTRYNRMHRGVDIAMKVGDTVRVAMSGVVKSVGYDRHGYGHYVVVSHDCGIETCYAHLSVCLVKESQYVDAEEPVGLSGNSGNSTGPHLHFETRYMGTAIDPLYVFDLSGRPASAKNVKAGK